MSAEPNPAAVPAQVDTPVSVQDVKNILAELKQQQEAMTQRMQKEREERAKELEQRMQKEREEHKAEIADLRQQMQEEKQQQNAKHVEEREEREAKTQKYAKERQEREAEMQKLNDDLAQLRAERKREEAVRRLYPPARLIANAFEAADAIIGVWSDGGGVTMKQSRAELEAICQQSINATPLDGYDDADETLVLAHLIIKKFRTHCSTCEAGRFPKVLPVMDDLRRPFPSDTRVKNREQPAQESPEAAVAHSPGAPLLQHSTLRMPKALELSMDSADWVFEPVLAAECKSGPWAPSMWRFRCLDETKQIDVSRQSNDCVTEGQPVADAGCQLTALEGVQHLWPLKNFHGRVFDFEAKDAFIRALVFVYLHTVWQRFGLRGERDRQKLQEGADRVDRWVRDVRKVVAGQAAAQSLDHLREWLNAMELPGDDPTALCETFSASRAAGNVDCHCCGSFSPSTISTLARTTSSQ